MKKNLLQLGILILLILPSTLFAESIHYTVDMANPENHIFQVTMYYKGFKPQDTIVLKMPVWTPGYYQRLDFGKQVKNFKCTVTGKVQPLPFYNKDNVWKIATGKLNDIEIHYDVQATRAFVANPYLNEERAYIIPAGVCMHPAGKINLPVSITVNPKQNWSITTGLDPVAGKTNVFHAPDFDILYDSPILAGPIETLNSFEVKGIPHYFKGIQLGEFDRNKLIGDLKKIVETATDLIGHIPYKHYTFIAIGPGAGGIEHLNNTTFSFSGNNLNDRSAYLRMLFFLTHEYFHHYNVKRIRPIELGPFDYDQGNRTNSLWVSEGISVYYEYLIVKRAGLCTEEELLDAFRKNMSAFENKTGKNYQTLAQASWETWSDGPFGRVNDAINKTISYYDKGPVVALLFDFKIRHMTKNKYSLDDVMRELYYTYYLKQKRGFTEDELKQTFEKVAGGKIDELFDYVYTTKDLDYETYLGYAGLNVDDSLRTLPGPWSGMNTRQRKDTIFISSVEYDSPAWKAGLRSGMIIQSINDQPNMPLDEMTKQAKVGDKTKLNVWSDGKNDTITFEWGQRKMKSYVIKALDHLTVEQKQLYKNWIE